MSFSLRQLRRPRSKVPFLQSAVGGLRSEEAACSTSSFKLSQAEGEDRADNRTERTPPATLYPGHRPTGFIERSVLTIGSGMAALMDQRRGDMVAVFGETTGHFALQKLKHRMMSSREGRRILKDRPRISKETLKFDELLSYPEGTLGRVYADFMVENRITPDSRLPVRYVNDQELAFVMQRYREVHDFLHTLLDQKTNLYGEIVVKWFEATQTELPMCALGGLGALFKLPKRERRLLGKEIVPKIVNIAMKADLVLSYYFEEHLTEKVADVKESLNLPPNIDSLLSLS